MPELPLPDVTQYFGPDGQLDRLGWSAAMAAWAQSKHEDEDDVQEIYSDDPHVQTACEGFDRLGQFQVASEEQLIEALGIDSYSEEYRENMMVRLQREQEIAIRVVRDDEEQTAYWRRRKSWETAGGQIARRKVKTPLTKAEHAEEERKSSLRRTGKVVSAAIAEHFERKRARHR